jgi:hypothetical protein
MLRIGDDDGAVGEFHLETGAIEHHVSGRHDQSREPISSEQVVADRDSTHRGPSGWGG